MVEYNDYCFDFRLDERQDMHSWDGAMQVLGCCYTAAVDVADVAGLQGLQHGHDPGQEPAEGRVHQ